MSHVCVEYAMYMCVLSVRCTCVCVLSVRCTCVLYRINNQQLANLRNSQARAVYFWARLLWVSIQLELQGTVHGYFGPRPDPFPEYDTVASGHLAITVPTYLGSTFSEDLVRSRFGVRLWASLDLDPNAAYTFCSMSV